MKATKGGNFKPVPLPEPQTTLARCYSVIDIGTVKEIYKGEDKGYKRKIYVTWEFPGLLAIFNDDKGEEPFVIGREFNASTGTNSNLSKLIAQWRNKPLTPQEQDGFDPAQMIGKTAYISFLHKRKANYVGQEIEQITNENTNMKFNGIMPKPKDIEVPPNRNPYMNWDWDKVEKDGFDKWKETFERIPLWLQKKMAESKEFKKFAAGYKLKGNDYDNDDYDDSEQEGSTVADPPKKTVGDDW